MTGSRRLRNVALAAALVTGLALIHGCAALGARASGPRRQRMEASPEWDGAKFVNPQPLRNAIWGSVSAMLHPSPYAIPTAPVPLVVPDPRLFATAPPSGLRVTWLGHSSTFLEIDGYRVLTDPVWSERATPVAGVGPKRWYLPPIALRDLPPIDAVLISHDHYDHLDYPTIVALLALDGGNTRFVVPLGVGADLASWGVPESRIVELDWWEHATIRGLDVTCTPARHASGRELVDNDAKLWAGYALRTPGHRVYYSGDTGLFPAMRDIGSRLGPFDLTMIEIGQYDAAWPDWHIGPEQAVRAHQMVRGRVMLPVHWGAFALAAHGWTEPIERALVAGQKAGVMLLAPEPGESVEPSAPPPVKRWWPDLPWHTAAERPIVSTQVD
jgi:L-ascorbate metabolism protein UlaG (beta-lactamase superfamily)